ncbi:uncharacterized protein LOC132740025 [Ruditapes philippinarum]|uniref:uncharacterized protein LOC132740025 n=1 Tax=Ruditapes philippinarum TaxID=129788 RepID=UPI00295ACDF0|nr:uncharacterized protein LOC132740025 [Ruditapes philippinarum]
MTRASNGDFHICTQCCDKADGCNKDLCTSHPGTNLRCLSCAAVHDPKDCQQIRECGKDEFCYVHKGISSHSITYNILYDFGCMGTLVSIKYEIKFNNKNCLISY